MALRHPELDLQRVEILQVHQILPRLHVGAGTDQPQPGHAVEGRPQHGLGQHHLVALQQGPRFGQPRLRLVVLLLAQHVGLDQIGGALEVQAIDRHRGLGLRHLRPVLGAVERDQRLAGLDRLAFLEMDALHPAGNLGADQHRLVGGQRTDRPQAVGQGLRAGAGHQHRRAGWRARRGCWRSRLVRRSTGSRDDSSRHPATGRRRGKRSVWGMLFSVGSASAGITPTADRAVKRAARRIRPATAPRIAPSPRRQAAARSSRCR